MAAHAIRVDELNDLGFFELLLTNLVLGKEERITIEVPAKRRVRNAEVQKNLFVKLVLADDEVVHACEKRARLGALNDAMIVSAADRNYFADAELRKRFGRHRLILRRVFDCARRDDY